MHLSNFEYIDNRIDEFWREYRQSAGYYDLPSQPGLAEKVRLAAGEALITLGSRIKPRRRNRNHLLSAWGGR